MNVPMVKPKYRIKCRHWNLRHVAVEVTANPAVNVVMDWKWSKKCKKVELEGQLTILKVDVVLNVLII